MFVTVVPVLVHESTQSRQVVAKRSLSNRFVLGDTKCEDRLSMSANQTCPIDAEAISREELRVNVYCALPSTCSCKFFGFWLNSSTCDESPSHQHFAHIPGPAQ